MEGTEHRHLDRYVEALLQSGNAIHSPWAQDKSGMYLVMRDPIDFTIVAGVPAEGMPVEGLEDADRITCDHCWAAIMGGRAVEVIQAQHESWSRWDRNDGYTWEDHALFDPAMGGHWYVDVDKPDSP